jgi:hypothetical protein
MMIRVMSAATVAVAFLAASVKFIPFHDTPSVLLGYLSAITTVLRALIYANQHIPSFQQLCAANCDAKLAAFTYCCKVLRDIVYEVTGVGSPTLVMISSCWYGHVMEMLFDVMHQVISFITLKGSARQPGTVTKT